MNFFDAHNHLNNELFVDTWREVAESAGRDGVIGMVINGGDVESSKRAVEIAEEVDIAYAAVGVHPEIFIDSEQKEVSSERVVEELRKLAQDSKKVVAIGELGLDYTLEVGGGRLEVDKKAQFELIEPQLALAQELNLPVVLHVRDVPGEVECFEDMVGLLKNFPGIKGQFHCWTGNLAQMEQALALNFYLSFSGILTYGSAGHIVEVAKAVPDDRLLIETDGPFLVPEPRRTEMRKAGMRNHERLCLPEYVTMTGEKLADLRQKSIDEIAVITTSNAQKLFLKTA